MRLSRTFSRAFVLNVASAIILFLGTATSAHAANIPVAFSSASDVPISTASTYSASGNTLAVTLNFVPAPGTNLMVVKCTSAMRINGAFSNLAQAQKLVLTYGGLSYNFSANYYGGSGNDLVLQWAGMAPITWGSNNFDPRTCVGPFQKVAAGSSSTIGLRYDGSLVLWGSNQFGICNVPSGLSGVVAIAGGGSFAAALKSDGTVVAWGYNLYGQTDVPGDLADVVAITAGTYHVLALKRDGTVVAWGRNEFGQINVPAGLSGVVAVAAGRDHSLALKSDGSVVCWGSNVYGQSTVPGTVTNVSAIAAGDRHSVAIYNNGKVAAWGSNTIGQTTVPANLSGVKAIASGTFHVVALKQDGTVVAWGSYYGGAGTMPTGLSEVASVAAGGSHTVALKNDGSAVVWGDNTFGDVYAPREESGYTNISCGGYNTIALRGDGTIFNWGQNHVGQGIAPSWLGTVVGIEAGANHSLAVLPNGDVSGWGNNTNSEASGYIDEGVVATAAGIGFSVGLRAGGTVFVWGGNPGGVKTVPASLSGVTAISAGSVHIMALKSDGTVVAWGTNTDGQATVPAGLSGVIAISAGNHHCMALKSDGTVVAWGRNTDGQSTVPAGLTGVRAIAAGIAHSVAVTAAGPITWGVATYDLQNPPANLQNINNVDAGYYMTVGLIPLPPSTTLRAQVPPTQTAATLYGVVNPNQQVTSAEFEVGLTSSYGGTAPVVLSGPESSTAQNVSAALSGLSPNTTYHYRLKASSVSGTSVTRDMTFTTAANAEIVVELSGIGNLTDGSQIALDAGSIGVGDVATKTFLIRNTGGADLTGLVVSENPDVPSFSITQPATTTLVPAATTTFTVVFSPASAGAHSAALQIASNDEDQNPFDISLTGLGLTALESWRLQHFGTYGNTGSAADSAMPHKDGVTNLMRFATGMDPAVPGKPPGTAMKSGNAILFTYIRNKAAVAAGVIYTVEWSTTLQAATWSSVGVTETTVDLGATEQVTATVPAGSPDRTFTRLKVISP